MTLSPARRAVSALSSLSWTTIWPALVWGLALGLERSLPVATAGALILAALGLDCARAAGWANRMGLGIRVRGEPQGWSWRVGPPAETTAQLLAAISLAISLRWLAAPLVVPLGTSLPLWPLLGALAAACGLAAVIFALVRGRPRSTVHLTAQQLVIQRGNVASTIHPGDVDRLRFAASDTKIEVIVNVRGRGAVHVLILPATWTAVARVRAFATALADRLQVPVVSDPVSLN